MGQSAITHRVAVEAGRVHFGRMVSTAVAWVLYAVGWVARHVCRVVVVCVAAILFVVGFSAAWCVAAVRVGWQEAAPRKRP